MLMMKPRVSQLIQVVFALVTLVGLAWLGYTMLIRIVSAVLNLQSDLAIAIIAASASVIVSVISLLISKYMEQRQIIIQEIRTKKVPVYERLISMLFKILFADKIGEEKPSEQETIKFFAEFTEQLIVWGADEVVRAFQKFRAAPLTGVDPMEQLFLYEDLLLKIRKDLGHANSRLGRGTLLGLFVNDIHKYVGPQLNKR
jgi:hypothetical protein